MNKKVMTAFTALCAAASLIVYIAAVALGGFWLPGAALYPLAAVLLIFLPGYALARRLVGEFSLTAAVSLSYCLGVAVLFLGFVLSGALGLPVWFVYLPPLALAALAVWDLAHHRPRLPAEFSFAQQLLLLCGAAALVISVFVGVFPFAHALAAGNMQYHQDMLWSVGNAAAVQYGAPLADLRNVGGTLSYHYLSDATVGFLARFCGVSAYDAFCAYHYLILIPALVCSLYSAARMYGAAPLRALAVTVGALFFSGPGCLLGYLRNLNGMAAAALTACTCLYLLFRPGWNKGALLAFGGVMLTALMSKNLYGLLIVCALGAALVYQLVFQRRLDRWGLAAGLLGLGLFAVLWVTIFSHAINNLLFQPWCSPAQLARQLLAAAPAGVLLWLIAAAAQLPRLTKVRRGFLIVAAAAIGGFLAYCLFHHYSSSHVYFFNAGLLFLWFALPELPALFTRRWAAALGCAVALAGFAYNAPTVAQPARLGVQVALRCAGLRPSYPVYADTVTPAEEEAILWLKQAMAPNEVFAVNRNAKDPVIGEGTWHYYTAMSERQAFCESWRYSMDYGYDYYQLRHNLEQVSDVLFAAPDAATAFAIARENGIQWLYVSRAIREEGFAGAEPVFENEAARIYRVV